MINETINPSSSSGRTADLDSANIGSNPVEGTRLPSTEEQLKWLHDMAEKNDYLAPVPIGNGRWAALYRFVFTTAIITGQMFDDYGYENRWCYDSTPAAAIGLTRWIVSNFEGEPKGWHRHPDSGRRRPDGDETKEYINR